MRKDMTIKNFGKVFSFYEECSFGHRSFAPRKMRRTLRNWKDLYKMVVLLHKKVDYPIFPPSNGKCDSIDGNHFTFQTERNADTEQDFSLGLDSGLYSRTTFGPSH